MKHIKLRKNETIENIGTSIGVKLGTKHRLQKMAKKGESYDGAIVRLMQTTERLALENERMSSRLAELGEKGTNILDISKVERGVDSIELDDGTHIVFTYNLPREKGSDELYEMDIRIKDTTRKGKNIDPGTLMIDPYQKAMINLWMIARVITVHFDPVFQVPSNTMIIDPVYWRQAAERVGLSEESYTHDILTVISDYERERNERA